MYSLPIVYPFFLAMRFNMSSITFNFNFQLSTRQLSTVNCQLVN